MSERPIPHKPSPSRMREINETIRYAMWSVFEVSAPLGDADRATLAAEVEAVRLAGRRGRRDPRLV